MNIFFLDTNIYCSAESHIDAHISKMPTETAQICSTVYRKYFNENDDNIYKSTHVNHPCTLWACAHENNFIYLLEFGIALCEEYSTRYRKHHKSKNILNYIIDNFQYGKLPKLLKTINLGNWNITQPHLAMPDIYKCDDLVKSYRNYYINEKVYRNDEKIMMRYTKRMPPKWLTDKFEFIRDQNTYIYKGKI